MERTAFWLIALAVASPAFAIPATAQTDTEAAALVATQVRDQGFECADPTSASRDPSVDDDAVWLLTCANASYRVRLVPDQAARIEPVN